MSTPAPASPCEIKSLPLVYRGKVRDLYTVDDRHLLMVASDRLSAFDVILPTTIPGKGAILTAMSHFWFGRTRHILPDHLQRAEKTLEEALPDPLERAAVAGRAVVARRLKGLPVEAIVRGYLIGSGWKDYQRTGAVCGIRLPSGLQLADRLPEAIFTPSTKAALGAHDENVSFAVIAATIGEELAQQVQEVSLRIYREAADYALNRGIIIADTKFEFGLDEDGQLVLMDEVLTPDSSRFWPADQYRPGTNPPSFDKQFVRDYLETLAWGKQPPGPELPPEIVARTTAKYREALERLTVA
ncbi:Phosphoribosylaminoimidazole-succinocarboxamide synthase [Candidatus Competibacter denitrificans Run_A_D11]|uniref:Phosphoribosylaminoimidazole-succinocarboxamide synthase n=1 Tax=Candidatus Competibacter denitrificans Run_A_D11 TaxID=1400863 RepID=W6ME15_9GAMM|nr:phosphoribosylaminoimidazolesuccinocarboxamide synthase [Candidatus Competibacter denitrificans]CDI03823.1 Phosphoribosylaminoimidazole-succinocarboxamide synthase [Candidatus Competibacter denitrificans Run_A_D11]HRC68802.1 phosphoribosylaminoimidazolesuccinocarboxamide synthase [Candidatus Competibacter denitrificans]